ncbi:hypothetical protein ASG53_12480 [Sanguibacter sp. Leaf3]|nr:hypothetical protein ASG53_12480 [Sanguibacter sp. Leaf3]
MLFEVDVEPLAACAGGVVTRDLDQVDSYALPTGTHCDKSVLDEGVGTTVPGDVDEADQPSIVTSGDPAQAVAVELVVPAHLLDLMAEALGVQAAELWVGERSTPCVEDGPAIGTGHCSSWVVALPGWPLSESEHGSTLPSVSNLGKGISPVRPGP